MTAETSLTDSRLVTFAGRNEALQFLKDLRARGGAPTRPEGRAILSIPEADMVILKARFPVLVNGASYEKKKFWNWFKRSPLSEPYRVR